MFSSVSLAAAWRTKSIDCTVSKGFRLQQIKHQALKTEARSPTRKRCRYMTIPRNSLSLFHHWRIYSWVIGTNFFSLISEMTGFNLNLHWVYGSLITFPIVVSFSIHWLLLRYISAGTLLQNMYCQQRHMYEQKKQKWIYSMLTLTASIRWHTGNGNQHFTYC